MDGLSVRRRSLIFLSVRGDLKIAALMFFTPRFAFLCPFFLDIMETTLLALIQLFVGFVSIFDHIVI